MKLKRIILITVLSVLIIVGGFYIYKLVIIPWNKDLQTFKTVKKLTDKDKIINGDIIFQTSMSGQSKAIQLATHSKYSHCGIVFWENGECYVWEAGKDVTITPIVKFIQKGQGGHFVIKRLKNSKKIFSSVKNLEKINKLFYDKFLNKPYDIYFGWSDDKIYCSELVWKLYEESFDIEIGKLEKLSDFDLTNEAVKQKMKERYGDRIPLNEKVISPISIFKSNLLITVDEK
jgi:hypothetical protein